VARLPTRLVEPISPHLCSVFLNGSDYGMTLFNYLSTLDRWCFFKNIDAFFQILPPLPGRKTPEQRGSDHKHDR
jgi:hypothetical protein